MYLPYFIWRPALMRAVKSIARAHAQKRVENWTLAHLASLKATAASGNLFALPNDLCPNPTFGIFNYWLVRSCLHGFALMRQTPRSVYPQGNNGSGVAAAHRPGATVASVPPLTPRKRGEDLLHLMRSLEEEHQLGFNTKDEIISPSRNSTAADAVVRKIQALFYNNGEALEDALAAFKTKTPIAATDQRLSLLSALLQSPYQQMSPASRSGTQANARRLPPSNFKIPQTCKCVSDSYFYT